VVQPIYSLPEDARERLAELDITLDILQEARQEGLFAYQSRTPHHPIIYGGTIAWAETIRSLRDQLAVRSGWRAERNGGVEFTTHPHNSLSIVVRAGNAATGVENQHPQPNAENGSRTLDYVETNRRLATLFPIESVDPGRTHPLVDIMRADPSTPNTWMLLIYRDMALKQQRAELSLPSRIDEQNQVVEWLERIILEPIDFDDDTYALDSGHTAAVVPEEDVPVKRRA
jgi:hypothetical protein